MITRCLFVAIIFPSLACFGTASVQKDVLEQLKRELLSDLKLEMAAKLEEHKRDLRHELNLEMAAKLEEHKRQLRRELAAGLKANVALKPERVQEVQAPSQDSISPEDDVRRLHEHYNRSLSVSRDASSSHHEWPNLPIVHQFADVDACLGGVMQSSHGTLISKSTGDVDIYNADESLKKTVPPAFIVHHVGDCSGSPTIHAELPIYAEAGLMVDGQAISAPKLSINPSDSTPAMSHAQNTWTDLPGLSEQVTLTAESTVIVYYSFAWESHIGEYYCYVNTILYRDTTELPEARAIQGIWGNGNMGCYGTNSGLWMGKLSAGTYNFFVKYRSNSGLNNDHTNLQYTNNLQVFIV